MIGRLVRTELQSCLHDAIVWGGTIFVVLLLFLSFIRMVVVRSAAPLADGWTGLLLASLGLASVVLGVTASRRNAREKRTRLFAELPVSTRDVSVASWCVRLLWLSIPTLAYAVFLARATSMPPATFALVAVTTYLGATTLVAAISVAMTIPHLPSSMSAWAKSIYVVCGLVVVVFWITGNLFAWSPSLPIGSLADAGLPGLTACLLVSGVGLVAVDVWLREGADDYLG